MEDFGELGEEGGEVGGGGVFGLMVRLVGLMFSFGVGIRVGLMGLIWI